MHLDLSHNGFDKKDSEKIALSLIENHSLLGVHFFGNTGYINSKGFLIIEVLYFKIIFIIIVYFIGYRERRKT